MVDAKCVPTFPMVVMGCGTLRCDAGSDRFPYKAEISDDLIGFRR